MCCDKAYISTQSQKQHAHKHTHTHTRTHALAHAHATTHTRTHTHKPTHTHAHAHTHTHTRTHTHMHTCTYVHTRTRACTHTLAHVYMVVYVCVSVWIYVYLCRYMRECTCIQIIYPFIVNVPKDRKIDANMFIDFTVVLFCMRNSHSRMAHGHLFASVWTDFRLTRLRLVEKRLMCLPFSLICQQLKESNPKPQPILANIIEVTAFVPENNRIYSDCPHATLILIIASCVEDNLACTNCEALAAEFEILGNVTFPMNAEIPVNWHLCDKYIRDPTAGAVWSSPASLLWQTLHWQTPQEIGHGIVQPTAYTISTKSWWYRQRTRRTGSTSLRENCQRIPSYCWQFPLWPPTNFSRNILGSLGIKQIHDSTRPNSSVDGEETSASSQRAQECHSTMTPSRLLWRTLARRIVQIWRRIFCRHNPTSTFQSRIRLLV